MLAGSAFEEGQRPALAEARNLTSVEPHIARKFRIVAGTQQSGVYVEKRV
jgi:hypothetical protein